MQDAEPRTAQEYLSLGQAARKCPGTGGRQHPHPSALFRWCRFGLLSRSGRHIRLRHVRIGRSLFTSAKWLDVFFCERAASDLGYFKDDEDDQEALGRASQELDRAGL